MSAEPSRLRIELPGGRRAGPHLPIGHGLVKAAERAAQIGASAIQIFSDNPTAWRRRPEPPPDAAAFRRRMDELDIAPLAIHAAYLVNLAGSDAALFARSVEVMTHELTYAPAFGASFVNVHAGSHRGSSVETGIGRLVDGLASAVGAAPDGSGAPLVVVENSSGGGDGIGVTLEELAAIMDAGGARGIGGRMGICLDTAHLWGAGYDISEPAEIDILIERFDELIGLDRLAMIHMNDTHSPLGSRHDRHAHLGEGRIGPAAMAHLLRHPALDGVAFYLETPDMALGYDAVNVARLEDLVAGRPLTPGPSAGGEANGSEQPPAKASAPAGKPAGTHAAVP
jgi:deoxyribonuclease-4